MIVGYEPTTGVFFTLLDSLVGRLRLTIFFFRNEWNVTYFAKRAMEDDGVMLKLYKNPLTDRLSNPYNW